MNWSGFFLSIQNAKSIETLRARPRNKWTRRLVCEWWVACRLPKSFANGRPQIALTDYDKQASSSTAAQCAAGHSCCLCFLLLLALELRAYTYTSFKVTYISDM